jgi:hypothetical protein
VLEASAPRHRNVVTGEEGPSPYRVKDEVQFEIDIFEVEGGERRPFKWVGRRGLGGEAQIAEDAGSTRGLWAGSSVGLHWCASGSRTNAGVGQKANPQGAKVSG